MQQWITFVNKLEKTLGEETTNKWLKPLKIVQFDARNLYLEADHPMQIHWFEEQCKEKFLKEALTANGKPIRLHLSLKGEHSKKDSDHQKKTTQKEHYTIEKNPLNPLLTFNHYTELEETRLTSKLLYKITNYDPISNTIIPGQPPLDSFNPIYLFGTEGTGKTHLLMAATQAFLQQGINALYVKAETFTQHVVQSIRYDQMEVFRKHYRHVDVLLIDDVHFFAHKKATQEELFHTFNTLHLEKKQIILSANTSPAKLKHLEPRLISRFEWGITLPIQQFKEEERKKILKQKAKALSIDLPENVEHFLCKTFKTSTSSLTLALETLLLRHHLDNQKLKKGPPLTPSLTKKLLSDLIREEEEKKVTKEDIFKAITTHFKIDTETLFKKSHTRQDLSRRQLAIYLCRKELNIPYKALGNLFSRDHSTIMSTVKQVQTLLDDKEPEMTTAYDAVLKKLYEQPVSTENRSQSR